MTEHEQLDELVRHCREISMTSPMIFVDQNHQEKGERTMINSIPRPRDKMRVRIARIIYANEPIPHDNLLANFTDNVGSRFMAKRALAAMLDEGQIVEAFGMYSLSLAVRAFVADLIEAEKAYTAPQLVPPRAAFEFRPLSAKHIPSIYGTRADAPRREDHHIVTIGGSDAVINWVDAEA